jgi:hypothetical protein
MKIVSGLYQKQYMTIAYYKTKIRVLPDVLMQNHIKKILQGKQDVLLKKFITNLICC